MARYENKKYLAYVRSFGCLVCGQGAQAHHLKMMYPAGMGVKVHDYLTAPLCAICHGDLHRFGDEATWWALKGVDPVEWANKKWRAYNADN